MSYEVGSMASMESDAVPREYMRASINKFQSPIPDQLRSTLRALQRELAKGKRHQEADMLSVLLKATARNSTYSRYFPTTAVREMTI
jgi:hypothetical protein